MTYSVDIAGFYYKRSDIRLADSVTVKEIMQEASRLDMIDRQSGGRNPVLQFMVEGSNTGFISTISVHHIDRAISRQKPSGEPTGYPARSYPDGEYVFSDDPVKKTKDSAGNHYFLATDLSGNPNGAAFVRTWQYYLYDQNGVDLARAESKERTVEPFGSKIVPPNTTVVWRVVLIGVAPSWQAGQKAN
jgi:hypothetical protein